MTCTSLLCVLLMQDFWLEFFSWSLPYRLPFILACSPLPPSICPISPGLVGGKVGSNPISLPLSQIWVFFASWQGWPLKVIFGALSLSSPGHWNFLRRALSPSRYHSSIFFALLSENWLVLLESFWGLSILSSNLFRELISSHTSSWKTPCTT